MMRKMRRLKGIIIIFIACLLAVEKREALGTSLMPLTLRDMALWSDAIVLAGCEEVQGEETDGIIRTRARFKVEETWKGRVAASITVSQLGGRAGRRIAIVAGAPRFVEGEKSVLFLQAFQDGTYGVVGFFQGKFGVEEEKIKEDGKGKTLSVRRDGGEGGGNGSGAMEILGIGMKIQKDGSLRLEDFKALVDEILGRDTP